MVMVASHMGRLLGVLLVGTLFACTDGEERPQPKREVSAGPQGRAVAGAPTTCSRKRVPQVRSDVRAVAYARGNGPVFVGLGTASIVYYTIDTLKHNGWYYSRLCGLSIRSMGAK